MTVPLFMPAIAEIWLAVSALIIVLAGAFFKTRLESGWSVLALVALVGAVAAAVLNYDGIAPTFNHMFIQDNMAIVFKLIIGVGSFAGLCMAIPYFSRLKENKFEYPVLVLLATAGMFGMVSAQDFLTLYVSLELQSLSLYVLATIRRDERRNSEAGLKYFFLGALSSGILLYGVSLLYGYAGSTSYVALANTLAAQSQISVGVIVGLVLVLSGIAFKISAAPFHMWSPDVYQGAPLPVTALFAMAPKVAAIAVLCRLVVGPFAPVMEQAQQILVALSVLSLAVGAFAGLAQSNIKRLMAYSSIGHVGFIVMALVVGGSMGVKAALYYTAVYVVMSIGVFAVLLSVYQTQEGDEQISSLSGLARRNPVLAASFAVLMFSMAGIPPMVGFFAKLYVLSAVVQANLVWLAVLGVVFSVVSAYYYLRLIKVMYFDATLETEAVMVPKLWQCLAVGSAIATILLLIFPQPLYDLASWAVSAL